MVALKKCPFCGGNGDINRKWNYKHEVYFTFVKCEMCGSQGKTFTELYRGDDIDWETESCYSAVMAWNMRTQEVQE